MLRGRNKQIGEFSTFREFDIKLEFRLIQSDIRPKNYLEFFFLNKYSEFPMGFFNSLENEFIL